jgi:hypothetical protein
VWVVDPGVRTVTVHTPDAPAEYSGRDEVDAGDLLPAFRCRVGELFGAAAHAEAEQAADAPGGWREMITVGR